MQIEFWRQPSGKFIVVNGPFNYVLAAESASLELSRTHSCQLFRAPDPNAKMCPLFLAGFSGGNNPPLRSATVRAFAGFLGEDNPSLS
jgi:hypothetical protein